MYVRAVPPLLVYYGVHQIRKVVFVRRLEAIANEQKVADALIFAGRVSNEELSDYYRLCDLYAMPSTGEGFGIVFLEALATGKPLLSLCITAQPC